MQALRERLKVDADTVVREFARIAFANARDYIPRKGEEFDFHRLNIDQTAVVEPSRLKTSSMRGSATSSAECVSNCTTRSRR
jgi:hypothetical protein